MRWELARGYRHLAAWDNTEALYRTPLLQEELDFRLDRTGKRLLHLLSLRYDRETLSSIRRALGRAERRANALELLDGLLDPPLRPLVLPWFDDAPIPETLARAKNLGLVGPKESARDYLFDQVDNPNPFVTALALDALFQAPADDLQPHLKKAAEDPSALVREVSLHLASQHFPQLGQELASRLQQDPDPSCRRRAQAILDPDPENIMHSTLEKVLLLKAASLFSEVAAEDLAPMALAAEEQRFATGEVILREGEVGDVLYVILQGEVVVSRGDTELNHLNVGDAFGEMAVLDAQPRSATITAFEDTVVLAIDSEDFYDVLQEQAEIAQGIIRMLNKRLREANRALDEADD
jgi:hypothetical protein